MSTSNQPRTPRKSPTLAMESPANTGLSSEQPRLVANRYHLPTPQSPNNLASYVPGPTNTGPESPVSHMQISHSFIKTTTSSRSSLVSSDPLGPEETTPKRSQLMMTPESSPVASRLDVHNHTNNLPSTPRTIISSNAMDSLTQPTLPRKMQTRSPSPDEQHTSRSRLSSPFVAKSSSTTMPATPRASTTPPPVSAGGELDRIHNAIQAQHDELENRRPEYLKRASVDLMDLDEPQDGDRFGSIGITDSPVKGRRIKLFQETSEESFEESLMAGGYGRYRTAEWVRQPQPIVVSSGTGAPVNVVAHLEEAQHHHSLSHHHQDPPPPPTEKELRKRKRLDAFRAQDQNSSLDSTTSRLYPVEIEGKGRVLLDVPTDPNENLGLNVNSNSSTGPSPTKRRKKSDLPTAKERRAAAAAALLEESAEKPNWPDAEFPWRLRTEERREQARKEEEERLTWVERFLDRDTDDEGDNLGLGSASPTDNADEEVLPSSVWGVVFEDGDERPVPYRAGRGKMVPLRGDPDAEDQDQLWTFKRRRSAYFPSDPADARAALLSKKSVRALSFRRQMSRARASRRRRGSGSLLSSEQAEERLCICRGTDDGRELVQCDLCNMWYHLECIGIEDISELGTDRRHKWFCYRCEEGSNWNGYANSPLNPFLDSPRSNGSEEQPTFAPTEMDDTPRRRQAQADAQFFQPLGVPESPTQSWSLSRVPRTPTRPPATSAGVGSILSSSSSSRNAPTTPRQNQHQQPRDARVIAGPFEMYGDDTHIFDPTSTPSRGIKISVNAPFTTPKTPSRGPNIRNGGGVGAGGGGGGGGGSFGAPGSCLPRLARGGVMSRRVLWLTPDHLRIMCTISILRMRTMMRIRHRSA
ncbi:hypothetical protein BT96DRAFT_49799 [Gymnopus androsaceus JB14]|uniref:PHD-type domain-containing protein n=1 Tax=Gymnopus androsaceus JB14 TaxID=1447944 RepID=A0A6A4HIC1_9AGAR|nr:hypothetical protein BT96DRAFT_49799 [Gymnopus androsaceus JB14]